MRRLPTRPHQTRQLYRVRPHKKHDLDMFKVPPRFPLAADDEGRAEERETEMTTPTREQSLEAAFLEMLNKFNLVEEGLTQQQITERMMVAYREGRTHGEILARQTKKGRTAK